MLLLSRATGGLYYELTDVEDGRSVIFQSDWDYPGLASNFGYRPMSEACLDGCQTDGTVACPQCGKEAIDYILDAIDFLDDHVSEECEDPGYL